MIDGFKRDTTSLNDYERDVLLPLMIDILSTREGKENAITNRNLCEVLNGQGLSIGSARVRKIISHIRLNDLISCLIATSVGYYVSTDPGELRKYIASLRGREGAIAAVRMALEEQAQLEEEKPLEDYPTA